MDFKDELNTILAEWDPVGMILAGPDWPKSEYLIHIEPLINFYREHKSVEKYLLRYFPPSSDDEHEAFNDAIIKLKDLFENYDLMNDRGLN